LVAGVEEHDLDALLRQVPGRHAARRAAADDDDWVDLGAPYDLHGSYPLRTTFAVVIIWPAWRVQCSAPWKSRPRTVVGSCLRPTLRGGASSGTGLPRTWPSAALMPLRTRPTSSAASDGGSPGSPSAFM